MITIIDYGLGNVFAFSNIINSLNYDFNIAKNEKDLELSDKIILPGVGSFDWAMQKLNESKMRDKLDDLVLNKKIPVLGVCVGMQIMFDNSEEGNSDGLSWIKGTVKKFKNFDNNYSVPHIGWNDVKIQKSTNLFNGINDPQFYFLHSYYVNPLSPECIVGITDYGINFPCVINHRNIFGTQFHPEKSHAWGLSLIDNFVRI